MLIEKTAGRFAAEMFEAMRSNGVKNCNIKNKQINLLKYKNNPRAFANAHLELFIEDATKFLTELLGKDHIPADQKQIIYDALMERVNDEGLDQIAKSTDGLLPQFEQTVLYKPDDEKPKPIIVNTTDIGSALKKVN